MEDTSLYSSARYAAVQIALQFINAAQVKWSVSDLLEAAQEIEDHLTEDSNVD